MLLVLLLPALLGLLTTVNGFPTGAGQSACQTMVPGHNGISISPRPTWSSLDNIPASYTIGEPLRITLTGTFSGFLLQARRWDLSSTVPVGTFNIVGRSDVQDHVCTAAQFLFPALSSVTHTNANSKTNFFVDWNPPSASVGTIYFRATVATARETWWMLSSNAIPVNPWMTWGAWSTPCSNPCGEGTQTRTRACVPGQTCIGAASEQQACNTQPCSWNQWQPWTACNVACGAGTRTRDRTCPVFQQCSPGVSQESQTCTGTSCVWAQWSAWTTCTLPCSGGTQTRTRSCPIPGLCTPGVGSETRDCNTNACVWNNWQAWSGCSVTCGAGSRTRQRTCPVLAQCLVGTAIGTEGCTGPPCGWNAWGQWSVCTVACGQGQRTRQRTCPFGQVCTPGVGSETEICTGTSCVWSQWTVTGACTAPCNGGTQTRSRSCPIAGQCGTGATTDLQACNTAACVWTAWSGWTSCNALCDGGTRSRTRSCPINGQCGTQSTDVQACNTQPCIVNWGQWAIWGGCQSNCRRSRTRVCPVANACTPGSFFEQGDCTGGLCPAWNQWGPWTGCSATCGPATQTRDRTCSGTVPCTGPSTDVQDCSLPDCQAWNLWGPWTGCSATCGPATQTRTRTCSGTVPCTGPSTDVQVCGLPACPVSAWNQWGPWSSCSATCGPATLTRTRTCSGTVPCTGPSTDVQDCNIPDCQGVWAIWGNWGTCPVTCGGGEQMRERTCVQGPCNGKPYETQTCNPQDCEDRVWSQWTAWSACSVTCEQGTSTRTRTCTGSISCPAPETDVLACTEGPCPDGAWGDWGDWGPCSALCGGGEQRRDRTCLQGRCYGKYYEEQFCNTHVCPVYGQWSQWSPCTVTCGGGTQGRTRSCTPASACPLPSDTAESRPCNEQDCITMVSVKYIVRNLQPSHFPQFNVETNIEAEPQPFVNFMNLAALQDNRFQYTLTTTGQVTAVNSINGVVGNPDGDIETRTLWVFLKLQSTPTGSTVCRIFQGIAIYVPSNYEVLLCTLETYQYISMLEPCDDTWAQWGNWGACSTTCGPGTRIRTRGCLQTNCGSGQTEEGPCQPANRLCPTCQQRFTKNAGQAIENAGTVVQAASQEDCETLCAQDPSCHSYSYRLGRCVHYTENNFIPGRVVFSTFEDFYTKGQCAASGRISKRDVLCRFSLALGVHSYGGVLNEHALNIDACKTQCRLTAGCRALDYEFNAVQKKCYIHTDVTKLQNTIPNSATDQYTVVGNCEIFDPGCERYRLVDGVFAITGSGSQVLTFNSLTVCQAACTQDVSCRCFDYHQPSATCVLHNNDQDMKYMYTNADAVHGVKGEPCDRNCTDFTEFKSKQAFGGTINAASSLDACKQACKDASTCDGLDFNSGNKCYLHDTRRTLHDSSTVDHYRRNDNCTTGGCVPEYSEHAGTGSPGGQPQSLGSEAECRVACDDQPTCVGFDLDSTSQPCWFFYNRQDMLNGAIGRSGVRQLRLLKRCGGGCTNVWSDTANSNIAGGEYRAGEDTLDKCKALCVSESDCKSIDWNASGSQKCWLHFSAGSIGTSSGVTHSELTRFCP